MKTLANICRAVFVCAAVLLGAVARLLAFFLVPTSDATGEGTREADGAGHAGTPPQDYGPFAGLDIAGDGYTGYTVHGREPITLGRNGERVGMYSGAPIIHF